MTKEKNAGSGILADQAGIAFGTQDFMVMIFAVCDGSKRKSPSKSDEESDIAVRKGVMRALRSYFEMDVEKADIDDEDVHVFEGCLSNIKHKAFFDWISGLEGAKICDNTPRLIWLEKNISDLLLDVSIILGVDDKLNQYMMVYKVQKEEGVNYG